MGDKIKGNVAGWALWHVWGEEKFTKGFWWRKVNERDRMEEEQIKSHEHCKRTDPSVAKPYPRQRLVFRFTLQPLYPPRGNPPLPKALYIFKFQYVLGGI